MKIRQLLTILLALFLSAHIAKAQNVLTLDVATNLATPWEILWGPDDYIWVTERAGKVSRVNPENGQQQVLITIPGVIEQSESGLLGMALHPEFSSNPHVFLAYTYLKNNRITEKIVRYEYADDKLQNEVVLLDDITGYQNHVGCRLVFGPDNKLYVSTGDAGNANLSQNRNSLNGKILRMNTDGSIPDDNPFGNSYVWATGSRNAQGLVWANGKLYGSEHGPSSDDEVNIYAEGRNYGWPNVVGFCNTPGEQQFCNDSNVVEPLYGWTPTLGVCGIDYYKSGNVPFGQWQNSLLLTSLKAGRFTVLHLSEDGEKIEKTQDFLVNRFGRLRDVCVSPQGRVFIATSNRDGRGNPAANDDRIIELRSGLSANEDAHIYNLPKILQNPASHNITINELENNMLTEVFDISGKRYFVQSRPQKQLNIDCTGWPNGMYIIKYQLNDAVATQKVIIRH